MALFEAIVASLQSVKARTEINFHRFHITHLHHIILNPGICALSAVPVRAEPNDRAELVTQLLFGECYQILVTQESWLQVQLAADDYVGWIDFKQHTPVTPEYYAAWCAQDHPRALDVVQAVSDATTKIPLTLGCRLPFFDGMNVRMGDTVVLLQRHRHQPRRRARCRPPGRAAAQNGPACT